MYSYITFRHFLFQASAAMLMKSTLFWGITRRRVVIVHRRVGATDRAHIHRSSVRYLVPQPR
jgi:hypothetical protein